MPSLPDQHSHSHVHRPVQDAGRAAGVVEGVASTAPGMASGTGVLADQALPAPGSLFLAGSRQRLTLASGLIAALWLMVWWALD